MEEIKVSEMPESEELQDDDIFMIIQNKANKKISFKKIKQDSGWIDLQLKDGVTVSSINNIKQMPQYRKIGKHIFLRGYISTTWITGQNRNIATLPYKPAQNVYRLVPLSQMNLARILITTNGVVGLEWIIKISDGSNVNTEVSWISIDMDFWID